jgi:serine/threonine-protein kinase Chk2
MLIVDPEKRFTIDQCLSHPWLVDGTQNVNDSTGGLVGGVAGLEVNRRAPARERTLLSSLNSVQVAAQVATRQDKHPVKVFAKNPRHITNAAREGRPDHNRAAGEFMEMGGKGDQELFPDENLSIYPTGETMTKTKKGKANGR